MPFLAYLGFYYLSFAAVAVAICLLLRLKWMISAKRAEEVNRLMVFATEEADRAEIEDSDAYVEPLDMPVFSSPRYHQCAVCFSPSATRCSRCKAVRYCSGKCQIAHWRQGHKQECQPFTTIHQNDYTGEVPSQYFLVQDNEIYGTEIENEGQHYARYVQSTPRESPLLASEGHPEAVGRNDDSEVECFLETERSDKLQSATDLPAKVKNNHVTNMDRNGAISLGMPDDGKSGRARSNTTTKSSSGSSADGFTNSSFSSTHSCSFWGRTVDSRRKKLDAHDDSSESSSSDAGVADMHTYESSPDLDFNLCWNNVPPVNKQNSSPGIVIPGGTHPPNLGMNKAIYRTVTSEEKAEDASKGKGLPSSHPKNSDCMAGHLSQESPVLKARNPLSCTPRITHSKSSRLISLSNDRSNNVGDMSSTLRTHESKESRSLTSNVSIANSSTTRTRSLEGTKPLKVGSAHAGGVCSDYANRSLHARNDLKNLTCKVVDNLKVPKISSHHHSAAGDEVAGRYTSKGLFSYDAFVKLYNWNNIEMRPCGLTNCGNSCYANAVLQCLACTPPLAAYLLQGLHSKKCEKKEWCFTCEFESLLMKVREGISPLSPIRILFEIQKSGSGLGNGREEDAHEFLRYSIDNLQSVCLKEARVSEPSSLEEETTLIGLTFGGYLRSKIKCMKCGGKSERHERMMDLTVEIEGDIGTLEAALRKFTGTEILNGENKYQCSRCRSYEKAKKKLKVQEAPNVLTIALKRFQSGKFGKLNKSIQFPEILDLAPYMSGTSDKSPIYKLYGVVVHLDVKNATFSGHYVCYVKNLQNKWFKVDDSVVTAVERAEVLSERAYVLLYARCSPRAPRSIRNSIVLPDQRKAKNPLIKLRTLSTAHWDEPSKRHSGIDCLYPNHSNLPHNKTILEDDSTSEISSLFSEVCSCSTASSNRDSSSMDELFDRLFGDSDQNWNSMWRHSSDSDSSSSSSSSPTPMYTKRSPLSNSDKYSSQVQNGEPDKDNDSFGARSVH